MSLRPEPLPPIPDVTAAAVRAAFPKGNLYVDLRAEFGTLYDDQLFADLYPPEGRPVEVAPWRLALVMVMQYIEGLTDRQAADAVRRCMDWKYALSLDLHDPGFDFTLLHDFRQRLLAHDGRPAVARYVSDDLQSPRLDQGAGHPTDRFHPCPGGDPHAPPPRMCPGSHALCPQSAQRCGAPMGAAACAAGLVSPLWPAVRPDAPAQGRQQARGPRHARSARTAISCWTGSRRRTARPTSGICPRSRRSGRFGCNNIIAVRSPGIETLRWRTGEEQAPAAVRITSPYDLEARYSTKRDNRIGSAISCTSRETCDPDHPDLITQVITTPATTPDCVMGPTIEQDLAARDLLPGTHLLDSGYVDADLLVTAQTQHQIDVRRTALGVL